MIGQVGLGESGGSGKSNDRDSLIVSGTKNGSTPWERLRKVMLTFSIWQTIMSACGREMNG